MRILITGIAGFVGSYLADYALKQGAKVYGCVRYRSNLENLDQIVNELELISCDVTDSAGVNRALGIARPEIVFHLAARSFVHSSFHDPAETMRNNVQGQINFLEAWRTNRFRSMLSVGSSEQYGQVSIEELPVRETNAQRPLSTYGVSKVAQDLLAYQYNRSYGTEVIRARTFNTEGPRRAPVFAVSSWARQIAGIELGLTPPVIKHGNLDAVRDFTDVRDVVEAYWKLMDKGRAGEAYNICSGRSWKMHQVLTMLTKQSTRQDIRFELEERRVRPSDVPVMLGDAEKTRREIGWEAKIPFQQTLEDLLSFWRKKLKDCHGS